ncbi:hypothetical protein [Sinomonas sp. ASV322]|uniref:hypothetical protein n=1 Tax=Sinomonas sp. ASV322 TaxID=3041920 RepID=UPI0027DC8917|nr:hypothetical protein [Sinomonas sp. ASV322]MDQ4501189.1 hypothetical protein [Sinomonas sp. ASV322]
MTDAIRKADEVENLDRSVRRSTSRIALLLAAAGPLYLVGAGLHPHAPDAHTMAEVAYVQTGQEAWWPAHLLLLLAFVSFGLCLRATSRLGNLPSSVRRLLRVVTPIAWVCVAAMAIHLVLPIGRPSVADSHEGWALWVKDIVESGDAVWSLCLAVVAWSLGRAHVLGNSATAVIGVAGGLGFGIFSAFVPLTGVLVPIDVMHSFVNYVPLFAILIALWALSAAILTARRPRA